MALQPSTKAKQISQIAHFPPKKWRSNVRNTFLEAVMGKGHATEIGVVKKICENENVTGAWNNVSLSALRTVGKEAAVPPASPKAPGQLTSSPRLDCPASQTINDEQTATQPAAGNQVGDFLEVAFYCKGSTNPKVYVGVVSTVLQPYIIL